MPVGCLGETSTLSSNDLDVIVTSSSLNTAEQFAFMQQTLLLQIFRVQQINNNNSRTRPDISFYGETNNVRSFNNRQSANGFGRGDIIYGEGGRSSSSSQSESSSSNGHSGASCPTCVAFSDACCQQENGHELFQEFVEANMQCYWDAKLTEAMGSLRYQGYVCPGILVMIASTSSLDAVSDAWRRRLLVPPSSCRISQLGVSNGCVVKPVLQTHCISLPDILCLILARLKQRNDVADMPTLCEAVERDWSNAGRTADPLKESVHAALGHLIKQRRVYYTGNKGYFLVAPSEGNSPLKGIGNRFNQLRHSLRDRTTMFNGGDKRSRLVDQECQTGPGSPPMEEAPMASPEISHDVSLGSNESGDSRLNGGNSYLERSQSLRISKKSLKNMSKGGSLRLSKKDALVFKEEEEEDQQSEPSNISPNKSESPPKAFERKNSFLGKLFSKKKSSPTSKPEIGSFSAQFPPPEMVEHYNSIYSAIRKPNREESPRQQHPNGANPSSPSSPGLNNSSPGPNPGLITSPTAQVRNGPNGNFVIYERTGKPVYIQSIPSTSAAPIYGQSPLRYPRHESMYSNPPPPLPYRPPPPNPYSRSTQANSAQPQQQQPGSQSPARRNDSSPFYCLSTSSSSSSGPSSMDSQTPLSQRPQHQLSQQQQQQQLQQTSLYDDTLVVIERSNKELESKLSPKLSSKLQLSSNLSPKQLPKSRLQLNRPRVDTIHNNRNLSQEVIYEVDPTFEPKVKVIKDIIPPLAAAPSNFPSLTDLSIADVGNSFKSLTAQKLMAGLSFNSIDTLLEVNAAAEARNKLNESTETIDFGVI